MASDVTDWFKVATRWDQVEADETTDADISLQDLTDGMTLRVMVYKDKNDKTNRNLLRWLEITDAKLESEGRSGSVGGNDTETFSFSSDMITIHPHGTAADPDGSDAF